MKCECAWCGKELPEVEADNLPADAVSHGICIPCGNQLMSEQGIPLQDFLESLGVPICAVSADGELTWAGSAMCSLVGKAPVEIVGQLGGEVFNCVNAKLPGGCGRAVHCSGCVIRRSVMHTHETGESLLRVPAVLKANGAGDGSVIELYVTTQKVDDVVLLRVDPVTTDTVEYEQVTCATGS